MSSTMARRKWRRLLVSNWWSICGCIGLCVAGCANNARAPELLPVVAAPVAVLADSLQPVQTVPELRDTRGSLPAKQYAPEDLVRLRDLDTSFVYDIRYATASNSFGEQLYACPDCLLRYRVAQALMGANAAFRALGLRLKLYDCYRPLSVTRRMWELVPNPSYVKNPNKGPSMHNLGIAVDLTLVDSLGQELNMGTDYDFFGKAAHHDNASLPAEVQKNRNLLRRVLAQHGFNAIRTEWWHYSYRQYFGALDVPFPCEGE